LCKPIFDFSQFACSKPFGAQTLRDAALKQAEEADQIVLMLGIRSAGYGMFGCGRKRDRGPTDVCKSNKAGAMANFTRSDGPYGKVPTNNGYNRTQPPPPGDAHVECETHDRWSIDLPSTQRELATAVIALGKPTVIVLLNGGAVAVEQELKAPNVAIIEAFYPGTMGSDAIAGAIFAMPPPPTPGAAVAITPGAAVGNYIDRWGRLPYSIYPAEWIANNPMDQMDLAASPGRTYRYSDMHTSPPLVAFGFGLQYTEFSLTVGSSCSSINATTDFANTFLFKLLLRNKGGAAAGYAAEAAVTMFVAPLELPTQPNHYPLQQQMVAFQRISPIAPGAQVEVLFNLTAADLSIVDYTTGDRVLAPGTYSVFFSTGTKATTKASTDLHIIGAQQVLEPFPVAGQ
jgi:hypothetical protein